MIDAVDVAAALAVQLNITPHVWPHPDPTESDNEAPHLVTDYTTAKEYVIPQISRKALKDFRLFVSPPPETRQEAGNDRCGREWGYMVECLVGKTITENDNVDEFQPMQLARIKKLMRFTDAVANFIDENRSLPNIGSDTKTGVLTEVTQISYDRDLLTSSGVFSGVVQATYRVKK